VRHIDDLEAVCLRLFRSLLGPGDIFNGFKVLLVTLRPGGEKMASAATRDRQRH
jgi:hypothetical protein